MQKLSSVDEDVFKVHPSNNWSVLSDAPFIFGLYSPVLIVCSSSY